MKHILKHPATNAACVSIFTAFYALVFILTSGKVEIARILYYANQNQSLAEGSFWFEWSRFLAAGHHAYIAYVMIAVTLLLVFLLQSRRRLYDEYHVARLLSCLVIAMFLMLMAIASFFILVLFDPVGIVEKFTLFITIHWITVVFADLVYVLVSKEK